MLAGGNPTVRLVPAEPPVNYFVLLHNLERFAGNFQKCVSASAKNAKIDGIMTDCSVVRTSRRGQTLTSARAAD